MHVLIKDGQNFIGYEYREISAEQSKASLYLDGYLCFGWVPDGNMQPTRAMGRMTIRLKRDRKIVNKAELTRLQRHFDACMGAIAALEQSSTQYATMWAIGIGIVGTFFLAGSVFAVTATPPHIWLCAMLGVPGLLGWILPYFVFVKQSQHRLEEIVPLIEQKYDEIYEICAKGSNLLL